MNPIIKHQYILVLLSLFFGSAGAWFIAKFGRSFNLIDLPSKRSSHSSAMPKGGGVGILAAFLVVSISLGMPVIFWLPVTILSLVSLIGDKFEVSPAVRLLIQFTASIFFLIGYIDLNSSEVYPHLLLIPLSVFMVGTANYYNFMDGINGIAGISGSIGFGLLAFYAHSHVANADIAILCICLSVGCLGFLPFNIPRARVFMGDVGSILLGFVFAATVIRLSRDPIEFIGLVSFLFPFYADEITTEFIRLIDGEKLWTPHRRHLYQILVNEFENAHWKIAVGYGIVQLAVGVNILLVLKAGSLAVVLTISMYFLLFCLITSQVRKRLVANSKS